MKGHKKTPPLASPATGDILCNKQRAQMRRPSCTDREHLKDIAMHHRTSRTNNSPLFYTTDLINYTPNTSPIKTRLPNRDFKTQGYRQTTNTDQQPPPVSQPYPDHQPATRNQHRMEPNTPTQTFRVRAENVINAGGILTNTHTPIIHLHRPTQPSPSRARPPPPPT